MAYRRRRSIAGLAVAGIGLLRCASSAATAGGGEGGNSAVCVAGQRVPCGCADGNESAKACKGDGSGYFACICDFGAAGASGDGGAAASG